MSVLLVDWLGRGGIAQTSLAWMESLGSVGVDCESVTRPGRELRSTIDGASWMSKLGRPGAHVDLVTRAVRSIRDRKPDVVVIQNHVLPPVEGVVDRTARQAGSMVVRVVHDHRLHSRAAGTQLRLDRLVSRADLVVAHSEFVARSVRSTTGRNVLVIPLPLHLGGTADPDDLPPQLEELEPLALQFGVVHRSYKGTAVTAMLAEKGIEPWRFAMAGAGARPSPNVVAIPGFIEGRALAAAVARASACLFPYRFATQSGGVALAQSLSSVPIATAVGGIVEQIEHGVTGLLVPPSAQGDDWERALRTLSDPLERARMQEAGRTKSLRDHAVFTEATRRIATGGDPWR